MGIWTAWLVLLLSVAAAHWGADRLAEPLQRLRRQRGFNPAAGATLVALATASPEIGTNSASALQHASDIGVGNLLGANIVSVPVIVGIAYLASRRSARREGSDGQHVLPLGEEANRIQGWPYLGVVLLAAALTLPAPWRGLQPVDGGVMLLAYAAYVWHAFRRGRGRPQPVQWRTPEILWACLGLALLVGGAIFTVRATETLVAAYGISQLVGGLFITATMSVLPEAFATWSLARQGQTTPAATSVIADNLATMTLGFFPLALAGTPLREPLLYAVNMGFVALYAVALVLFIRYPREPKGIDRRELGALLGIYLLYVAVMAGLLFAQG